MQFYLRHLSLVHSNDSGFCFQCRLNGCKRTFKNMGTYRNHVYSLHTDAHCTSDDLLVSTSTEETNTNQNSDLSENRDEDQYEHMADHENDRENGALSV